MASEYPVLSKCFDAKWFKKRMKCQKKVAFEYIAANARFRTSFGKYEAVMQELLDEIEGDLDRFIQKNMSETGRSKIEVMAAAAKKEADEKKAKKNKEKYGIDLSGPDGVGVGGKKKNERKAKEEDDQEDEDKGDDDNSGGDDDDKGALMKKVGINDESAAGGTGSITSLVSGEIKRQGTGPLAVDTASSSVDDKPTPLTPTPRRTDIPRVHQTLLKFSKANLFAVYKDGVAVPSEISLDEEKRQIHVSI